MAYSVGCVRVGEQVLELKLEECVQSHTGEYMNTSECHARQLFRFSRPSAGPFMRLILS